MTQADERERRVAANEALFRAANNRIEDLNRAFQTLTEEGTWLCECADATCLQRIRLPLEEYEQVRAHPARFIVVRGHELSKYERVVEERDDHMVVEKRAGVGRAAAAVAEREDRRATS